MSKNTASTLSLTIKARCRRCLRVLGEDGKCHNPKCPLCVDKDTNDTTATDTEVTTENNNVMFS